MMDSAAVPAATANAPVVPIETAAEEPVKMMADLTLDRREPRFGAAYNLSPVVHCKVESFQGLVSPALVEGCLRRTRSSC